MTEKEAKFILEEIKDIDDTLYSYSKPYMDALIIAIKALEEVQEYRKLGTVEELKVAWKYVDLAKKHNTIGNVIKSCAEYESIGTVEEIREAVEKDTAKKVIIKPWEPCKCPTCDKELSESVGDGYYKHYYYLKRCPECGQRLDWGEQI